MRQFGLPNNRYSGPNYAQLVAVYPDRATASRAISEIQQQVRACPAKESVAEKKVPGTQTILNAYKANWNITDDTILGWSHIQGFEKRTYSPSISTLNVIYESYDYAVKSNVVVASVYWERTKPNSPGGPIQAKASKILAKQLEKIG